MSDLFSCHLALIAIKDLSNVIAIDDKIPWDIPEDREYFRSYIQDETLLVGASTYSQMESCFSGQKVFLLSKHLSENSSEIHYSDTTICSDPETVSDKASQEKIKKLVVIGGASVYKLCFPFADELLITEVQSTSSGGLRFPEIKSSHWKETWRRAHSKEKSSLSSLPQPLGYDFVQYLRK